jgi:hypothetical protein
MLAQVSDVEECCLWVAQSILQRGLYYGCLQRDAVDELVQKGRAEDPIVLADVLCDCLDEQVDRHLAKVPLMTWPQLVLVWVPLVLSHFVVSLAVVQQEILSPE